LVSLFLARFAARPKPLKNLVGNDSAGSPRVGLGVIPEHHDPFGDFFSGDNLDSPFAKMRERPCGPQALAVPHNELIAAHSRAQI